MNHLFSVKLNFEATACFYYKSDHCTLACAAEGALNNTCSQIYCGSSPHSEPETQAVTDFLRSRNGSVQIYYTIHSYSQLLLFPYGHTLEKTPTHDELVRITQKRKGRFEQNFVWTFIGQSHDFAT